MTTTMTRMLLALFLLSASLFGAPAAPSLSGTASLDVVSAYTFRGAKLANTSIQPTLNASYGSLYGTIWANRPTDRGLSSEVDLTLGGGARGFDGGITVYTYPGDADATYEPYIGYARDLGDLLKGSVYLYRDITLNVTTGEGKLSLRLPSIVALDLSLDAAVGTVRGGGSSYTYWSAGPVVKLPLTKSLTASAAGLYTSSSGADLARDILSGRVGVSWSF